MLFFSISKSNKRSYKAWLYRTVFYGNFSLLTVIFLLSSFFIQPFHQVAAAEPTDGQLEEEPIVAEDVAEQPIEEVEAVEEVVPTPEQNEAEQPPSGEQEISEADPIVPTVDEFPADTATSSDSGVEIPTEETSLEEVDASDDDAIEEIDQSGNEPEQGVQENEAPEEQASSSQPSAVEVQYLVTDENFYQFAKNACVAVGDGTYHCSKKVPDEADTNSVVYAEQGESGNMEIFLKTSRGKIKQITENIFDDTAPYYDPESMRITWQRLIDGRYQVILYDILSEKETQLTFSKTNNMEPKVSASGIVWQAWDNNDWEVMYFDGAYTEQITNNNAQDVTPVVQDRYILWSVLGIEEQEARVYSLDTKETVTISGHEGGSIINPRFVLVYDTEFDNGDTVTKSFDPTTGLSELVAATPAPEPVNIPETDPLGEIRALLINGKPQRDDKELPDIGAEDPNATSTATSSDPGTLNLKSDDGGIALPIMLPTDEPFVLTEYDLVIPGPDFFLNE